MNKFYSIALILWISGCTTDLPSQSASPAVSHEQWDSLLVQYVDEEGSVDYRKWQNDTTALNDYLEYLGSHPPDKQTWSNNAQLAYWINAYNAFTIKLILDNYPLNSIKDIGPSIQIPRVNTPWQISFIRIGNKKYHLDDIEHGIIRSYFDEPRIHFALVCASRSCPSLRNEAYTESALDQQLTDQARIFLSDVSKNVLQKDEVVISKLFKWYKGDFTKESSLNSYINQYTDIEVSSSAKIRYMDYNWQLNDK